MYMIHENELEINITSRNLYYYIGKGYECSYGETISVKIGDLNPNCKKEVSAMCDCGNVTKMRYEKYLENKKRCGFYGCRKCSNKKRIILNNEKYGVDSTSQLEHVKEKREKTNIERYGTKTNLTTEETKFKIKKTNLKRYGVEYVLLSKEVREKGKNTLMVRYGVEYTFLSETIRNKSKDTCLKRYGVEHPSKSIKEKELSEWLKTLNIQFKESDRKILEGKELDIYIPEYNLAIEFNGLYWHSEKYKDKNYHLDKSLKCLENGIDLIHIWEDEWAFKQDIVKSIISNRLNKNEKIYARKCVVKSVDKLVVKNFLESNHIDGYVKSNINIGLYYNNDLVCLMCLKKKKNDFEIVRTCTKLNYTVIGAISKLLNHFKKNYKFDNITTSTDFRLFNGNVYEKLGFIKQKLSKPKFYWCKYLVRNLNKIKNTEGYFKVFGCGCYKWLLKD